MLVLFTYDIPDDRRRLQVARILDGVAGRVQYSVFEGHLDDVTLDRTLRRLERILVPGEDALRLYRICATCARQVRILGRGTVVNKSDVIVL